MWLFTLIIGKWLIWYLLINCKQKIIFTSECVDVSDRDFIFKWIYWIAIKNIIKIFSICSYNYILYYLKPFILFYIKLFLCYYL